MSVLLRQAGGYLLTGGLAAVVDIGGFHLLAPRLGGLLLPAVASFLLAAVVNYLLTSAFVFRRDWRNPRRAALFLLFATVGLAVNAGSTWALATSLPLPPTLAKVGGVGIAFVANFLMNALIVFRGAEPAPAPTTQP
ncbi:GtrA family protein [Ramlibacter sp. AN1015]|uniref:GtrA family protein n=1 Tax=Ramlibacter sp. AN1015 TaxID=3133428 RepID=UPI0030C0E696